MRRLAASLLIAAFAAASLLTMSPAMANGARPFTAAALQADQAAGKPVIVHVTAKWCSTCAAQLPIVTKLLKDPKYKNLVVLNVDFDKQKAALRELNVQAQSTFVAFKGKKEVGRSTGETDKDSIKALFDTAS